MTAVASQMALPRYSAEDFETLSIHSIAPSYLSEVPSYHSTNPQFDASPAYSPRTARTSSSRQQPPLQRQATGLPPVPVAMPTPNIHNFRIPLWSTSNALAARQIRSVVERRVNAALDDSNGLARRVPSESSAPVEITSSPSRPLEDPYLVGEAAAAEARRERLARESGDDILIREDKQWDWLLIQMKDWEEREKSWAKFRREVDSGQRKKLLRRIGGRFI